MNFKLFSKVSISLFILLAFMLLINSCASIVSGSKQEVSISSSERDADVFINGKLVGITPTILKLKRGKNYLVEIKKKGFDTYRVETGKGITGWFWGNLLCGGVIGMVIDLATGNAFDIDPDTINPQLTKVTSLLNNQDNDNYNRVYMKDSKGNLVNILTIQWE